MKNKLKSLGVAVMPKTLTGRCIKKPIVVVITTCILVFFMSCGTTAATNGNADGLPLFFDTIEQAADRLSTELGDGTRVAVVAFESRSNNLSRFIIDELTAELIDRGVNVMTRQSTQLDLIMAEVDFGMTGLVSDDTAQRLGHILGVEVIITGQLMDLGRTHRFMVSAIQVETARNLGSPRFNVRNDSDLQERVAALDGHTVQIAQQPQPDASVQERVIVGQVPDSIRNVVNSVASNALVGIGRAMHDSASLAEEMALMRASDDINRQLQNVVGDILIEFSWYILDFIAGAEVADPQAAIGTFEILREIILQEIIRQPQNYVHEVVDRVGIESWVVLTLNNNEIVTTIARAIEPMAFLAPQWAHVIPAWVTFTTDRVSSAIALNNRVRLRVAD